MPDRLLVPARRKAPTVWALWNDLFHQAVSLEFISKAMDVMAATPRHTYIVLTKRAVRMHWAVEQVLMANHSDRLPANIWLGVTAENQARAEERLPLLEATSPVVKVVSVEPMLGPMDLTAYLSGPSRLDWVLCGGESGPGARPMDPDWARSLRDQCRAAGVAFFFKQWGEWAPDGASPAESGLGTAIYNFPDGRETYRVGKAAAGHLLDGETLMEFPTPQPPEGG